MKISFTFRFLPLVLLGGAGWLQAQNPVPSTPGTSNRTEKDIIEQLRTGKYSPSQLPSFYRSPLTIPTVPPVTSLPEAGDLEARLKKATVEQREAEALPLALKILKLIPLHGKDDAEKATAIQWRSTRVEAILCLKKFNALDEYERKVKAYYKDDVSNPTYDRLMAECLFTDDDNRDKSEPYLEKACALDPNDPAMEGYLVWLYQKQGKINLLLPLVVHIIEDNVPICLPLAPETVERFKEANQLDQLTQACVRGIKNRSLTGPSESAALAIQLKKPLEQLHKVDDLILLYPALAEIEPIPQDRDKDRAKLATLLLQKGDRDGFGQLCEEILFPKYSVDSPLRTFSRPGLDLFIASGMDLVRLTKQAGQFDRIKKRAEAEYLKGGSLLDEQALVLVLIAGQDADVFTRLPDYTKEVVEQSKASRGTNYEGLYAIFNELLSWPEAKPLLKPTLQAAWEADRAAQPQNYAYSARRVAELALPINEKALAQEALQTALIDWGILPSPTGAPPVHLIPAQQIGSFENLRNLGKVMVKADMAKELETVIAWLADDSKTEQGTFPDSRNGALAEIGKAAYDAGLDATARDCAKAAVNRLQNVLLNPPQTRNGFTQDGINPQGVHLTFYLLARLGMSKEFDSLQALLSQPNSLGNLASTAIMLADAKKVQARLSNPPGSLTPIAWLVGTGMSSGHGQKVAWDMDADIPQGSQEHSFSIETRPMIELNGKFSVQIVAGNTEDDLRVVKTIPAADARGSVMLELHPDDRFLRVTCQSSDAEPKIYTGPLVPIALAENLFPSSPRFRVIRQSYSPTSAGNDDLPFADRTLPLQSIDGPSAGDMGGEISSTDSGSSVELIGTAVPIEEGTVFSQSGWVKGPAQWGVRYLDDAGHKVSDKFCDYGQFSDDWRYVHQNIEISAGDSTGYHERPPPHAVSLEPILELGSEYSRASFQGLYFGMTDRKPVAINHIDLIKGLPAAISMAEAPQGKILAGVFTDGTIRCYDLASHAELGLTGRLTDTPVDVGFVNQGASVVAADVSGNVFLRAVSGQSEGKIVFHAPWRIGFMSASAQSSLVAVGNSDSRRVLVYDVNTGEQVSEIKIDGAPIMWLVISPDGNQVYCAYRAGTRIWNSHTGEPVPTVNPWIQHIDAARLFKFAHAMKLNYEMNPGWLQVENGFIVSNQNSSLNYSLIFNSNVFQHFDTEPLAAFCLSTQNNDVYAETTEGTLQVWSLPQDIVLHPYVPPTPAPPLTAAYIPKSMPAPPPSLGSVDNHLVIQSPGQLRGFPGTTLGEPLQLTVTNGEGMPMPTVNLQVKSDLKSARFKATADSTKEEVFQATTDKNGEAMLFVSLGKKPGRGDIVVEASTKDNKQEKRISLEAIDENAPLKQPHDIQCGSEGQAMHVSWSDDPDNRTGFILQRRVDGGPWYVISVVPGDVNTYTDSDIEYSHEYSYGVASTNGSEYGYPPKMLAPPDRLGRFLP